MGKGRNGSGSQIVLNRKQNVRPDIAEDYPVHMHVPKLWGKVKDIVYRKHLNAVSVYSLGQGSSDDRL